VRELLTDSRFLQCTYQKYPPSTSIDADTIVFDLNRFESASLYQIQNTCIKVRCKITKADGTLPDKTKKVWLCNNILHSLFSAVRVSINEQPVVKQPDNYHYKAYFAQVFSYSDEYKNAQGATVGFYKDVAGHLTPKDYTVNVGYQNRHLLFRTNYDAAKPYRKDGAELFGRLQLDFVSLESGVPPGTKIHIELVKNCDKFLIMREKLDDQPEDTEEYKVKILDCYLFVPIAQVSAPIYSELSSILTSKSISLHFRRTEIRPLMIPRNKEEFNRCFFHQLSKILKRRQ